MWLTKLKIAIIEKDTDALDKLLDQSPEFKSKKEMIEASYLLKEALEIVSALKDETSLILKKIKKNRDFLDSTQAPIATKLDIKS